jgi:hypothetical protein
MDMQISESMGDSPAHASFPTRSRADNAGSAGGRTLIDTFDVRLTR